MFEFASGVINVWEKKLLSSNDQERMLNAPDRASAFLVLFDTDLGELATVQNDVEKIFEQDLLILKSKLERLLEDSRLIEFLFLQYDAWNLKIALKRRILSESVGAMDPLVCSLADFTALDGFLQQTESSPGSIRFLALPLAVRDMAMKAQGFLADLKKVDSAAIEEAVDKSYYAVRRILANDWGGFLVELVRWEIDLANVKSLMGGNGQAAFLAGGNLKKQDVLSLFASQSAGSMDLAKFLETLNLSFIIDKFTKAKSEIFLEQGLQSFLSQRVIMKEKETGVGLEKVVSFFYRKLNSYFNIRIILFAKDNNWEMSETEKLLLPL